MGIIDIIILLNLINEKFLKSNISRCPATMLAVSRTDKVIGRIMFLTISIINIKLMRISGVPIGIVWIIMCFAINLQAKIIIIIHIENVNENVILIWAVGVKMKGNKAIKFKIMMNKKITLIKKIIPLGVLIISAFISLLILLKVKCFLFPKNFNLINNMIGNMIDAQEILIVDEDGSKIENRFIIIISLRITHVG